MFITGGVALSLELIAILLSVALISFAKTHKNVDTSPAKATGWVVFIFSLALLICTSFLIVIAAHKRGEMMMGGKMWECPCKKGCPMQSEQSQVEIQPNTLDQNTSAQ